MRFRSVGASALVALSVTVAMFAGSSAGAIERKSTEGTPTVTGPVTGGKGVAEIGTDIYDKPIGAGYESVGYTREEYFFGGTATSYKAVGKLTADGKWKVKKSTTAPYKTRMVVVKPKNPADFNGTVYVEWLNVTAGFDASRVWIFGHNQMLREGAAWVGISAQAVGVEGTGTSPLANTTVIKIPTGGLKSSDPARYGTLSHPGDAYSYDIFRQAGLVVRGDAKGVKPFKGYKVKRLVAAGESQSAFRMTTYVNVVEPMSPGVYDAYFILHRGASPAPLGTQVQGSPDPSLPAAVHIRTDLKVPVFTFVTEMDDQTLGYANARQPDTNKLRTWEVAATSHADAYTGYPAISDFTGAGALAEKTELSLTKPSHGSTNCDLPVNAGGQQAVVRAALVQLERWINGGKPPTKYAAIKTTGSGKTVVFVRDANGIARGGVRTPIADVPIAANNGNNNTPAGTCRLDGTGVPFDAATLARLYPNGSADYIKAFNASADKAVKAGIWLKPDAKNWKAAAAQITFP